MIFKSTYNELLKIAYKPRSYIGIGGIIIIIAIILFALKVDGALYNICWSNLFLINSLLLNVISIKENTIYIK